MKIITFLLGFILLSVVTAVSGFHKSWLINAEAEALVSQWDEDLYAEFGADLLAEYAPLPERDRTIIKYHCEDIYTEAKRLFATKSSLDPANKPGCQALILGGWYPGWTIADGMAFIRDPVGYRR